MSYMCIGMCVQYLPLILSRTILATLFIIMAKLLNSCSFKFSVLHVCIWRENKLHSIRSTYVTMSHYNQYKVNLCYIIITLHS